ncbi:di-heme-cytochrome C peroxidase [Thalassomonas sp. RHCl1]|uniref:di-heme-cytochrome C peroxidase n=1 Tax=Thalassomonas sp. RHCl1 TaxID=2995320 RepID=UPI00248C6D60|nr:di-heme-cytochrome C peroxidase [Thalassomonas sp. RHCl1]
MKIPFLFLSALAAASLVIGCATEQGYTPSAEKSLMTPAIGDTPTRVELPQAWNDDIRMKFWFTDQGARIMPYTWFTWLEQPDSREYFRSSAHMEFLRYLPMPSSLENPAGLPIGFALGKDRSSGEPWMGMTCAACHTNQLDYNGTRMLIEGAPTLANFVLFFSRLVDALNNTHSDAAKFERFARKVLADEYNEEEAQALKERLGQLAKELTERRMVNALPDNYDPDFTSYARLDAFGNIQNAGSVFALRDLNNGNPPTAPVSYPFLWGTHQSDVVQWNASAPNTPVIGPLIRNMGEVVGVFGHLNINNTSIKDRLKGGESRYSSTVEMLYLGDLETWVRDLRSPQWPQQYLPAVDANLAGQGKTLYKQYCAKCHQVIPRANEGEKYISVKTPVAEVGTDPETAWNADFHMAKSLFLEGEKNQILVGARFKEVTPAILIPANGVVGLVLKDPLTALEAGLKPVRIDGKLDKSVEGTSMTDHLKAHFKALKAMYKSDKTGDSSQKGDDRDLTGLVYKARPLNGIWATAPYMHNGSIPNLWELLKKPKQRLTSFWVGSREFDPARVGYKTDQGLSLFRVLDDNGKIIPGSSNRGHSYGSDLSESQRWALVEYMKTL